ncbi:MAG: heme ABC transporter ATP-binding protein [Armatimonadota bacterium]|nr:heme ABC transporter ATP-binding protein [bacterium]MDW8320657.1 heme ABC transporter ATP-binding protein [Armatimonadota bacterium]
MGSTELIRAADIWAGYGATPVLKGIQLRISRGELVGLLGPNGSGKSTLLRVLSGVLKPQKGQVWLDGQPLSQLRTKEVAQRLAFVPQREEVAFGFTAWEVVLLGRAPYVGWWGREREEDVQATRRAMERTDSLSLGERIVGTLSGGERQRVVLARGLAQETPLLFLDEPLTHLDVAHQVSMLSLLRQLNREESLTVLAALHDLNLASEFCDRLIVLRQGQIVADGAPSEVITPVLLARVFGLDAWVRLNPVTGRPHVLPRTLQHVEAQAGNGRRVHVICGGGTGAAWIAALARTGWHISVGVLHLLDSDEEIAQELGAEVITEAPFTPISSESLALLRDALAKAEAILVAPVAFGHGNLANLQAVEEAQRAGKRVLVADCNWQERDFTSGQAREIIERLKANGAQVVATPEEATAKLE